MDQMVFIFGLHADYFDYVYIVALSIPLTFITFFFFSYKISKCYDEKEEKVTFRDKVFFLGYNANDAEEDINKECLIRGLVIDHAQRKCTNPECYSHK